MVTAGASEALLLVMQALVDDGDRVLHADPAFVWYAALARLAGGRPEGLAVDERLRIDVEAAKAQLDRAKVLVINSPANPTGAVEPEASVKALVEYANDAGATVVSDEVYEHFVYDGVRAVSAARFGEDVVTINATSKTYAMTGWRLGWFAGSEELVEQANKIHQYRPGLRLLGRAVRGRGRAQRAAGLRRGHAGRVRGPAGLSSAAGSRSLGSSSPGRRGRSTPSRRWTPRWSRKSFRPAWSSCPASPSDLAAPGMPGSCTRPRARRSPPRSNESRESSMAEQDTTTDRDRLVRLLARLSNAHGVSGSEGEIREIVREELAGCVDECYEDRMGNLIAVKRGDDFRVMLASHMDEIGFMVKYVEKEGFLRFAQIGGWYAPMLAGQRVWLHGPNGPVLGVLGSKAVHIMDEEERKKPLKIEEMFIDVGAESADAARGSASARARRSPSTASSAPSAATASRARPSTTARASRS